MKKIFGSLIILGFLLPLFSFGAISIDNITTGPYWSNANNWSTSHTTAGDDRTLVVVVYWWDNSGVISLSGVTYGGIAMTFGSHADQASYVYNADTYYLANPATGSNNVVVTFSANSYGNVNIISLKGTYTASPKDNSGTFSQTGSASTTTTFTAKYPNSLYIDGFAGNGACTNVYPYSTTGQIKWGTNSGTCFSSSKFLTTASGTYNVGWNNSGVNNIGMAMIGIRENVAGPYAELVNDPTKYCETTITGATTTKRCYEPKDVTRIYFYDYIVFMGSIVTILYVVTSDKNGKHN